MRTFWKSEIQERPGYCSVEISHEETCKEYTSVNIDSNIMNLQLTGKIKIQALDKKYRFSFRRE